MSNQDPSKPQGRPRLAPVREDAIDLRDPVDADHGEATATPAPASRGPGPQPVVDLDAVPRSRWRLDTGRVYAWNRRLWRVEQIGCVLYRS